MAIFSSSITNAGLSLTVRVGLNGKNIAALQAHGQPIPEPVQATALIDTGTDITAVASSVFQQLMLTPTITAKNQTASGTVDVNLYLVSLDLVEPASGKIIPVYTDMLVSELAVTLPDADVLIGQDVLAECLVIINGPKKEFSFAM
jgi:hypothetical protein